MPPATSAEDRPWILHIDLDQFIAAVEVLRRPELRGLPVIVGGRGDPTERAVVATASYEAREFGVHSGMPLRTAVRRCPDAILLPSDPAAYDETSEQVMTTLRQLDDDPDFGSGVVVEVMGWDEAFLGVHTADPEGLASQVQRAVAESTRLSCSIGIGDNKLRAKMATGFAKPAGIYRLTKDNWYDVLGDRPTEALWGIGRKTARKLAELGLHTVIELASADPAMLAERLGPTMGPWFVQLGRGAGSTTVSASPWVARGRSRETTFQHNLTDWADVRREVAVLARRVVDDIVEEGRPAVRVGLKVRFAPFFTHTRSLTLPEPTSDADAIERAALDLTERFEDRSPVRLLGVRVEFERP
jgi:DNA polymerase-4